MVRPVKHLQEPDRQNQEHTQVSEMIKLVSPVLKGEKKTLSPTNIGQHAQGKVSAVLSMMRGWRINWSVWRRRLIIMVLMVIVLNTFLWGMRWWKEGYQAHMIIRTQGYELNQSLISRYQSMAYKKHVFAQLYQFPLWVQQREWLMNWVLFIDKQQIILKSTGANIVELSVISRNAKRAKHLLTLVYQDYLKQHQDIRRQELLRQEQQLTALRDSKLKEVHQQIDEYEVFDGAKRFWTVSSSIDKQLSTYLDTKKAVLAGLILIVQEKYSKLEEQLKSLRDQNRMQWLYQIDVTKRLEYLQLLEQLMIMEIHRFAITEDLLNAYQRGIQEARDNIMVKLRALAQNPEQAESVEVYGQWLLWRNQYEAVQVLTNQRWVVGAMNDTQQRPWVEKWDKIQNDYSEYKNLDQQLRQVQDQLTSIGKEKVTINSPVKVDRL